MLCGSTFLDVQYKTAELACVGHDGMDYSKLRGMQTLWYVLLR